MNQHKRDCICFECINPLVETMRKLYREIVVINEDFMGSGAIDSQLPVMTQRHMMTQLPGQKDRDDLMKPYKFTVDKSSKKANLIRKKYRNKNRKNAKPFARLPYGF